jgi:hypothetical protein
MTNNRLSPPRPDSQRTPPKVLAEVLEEAKADIRKRLEKYPFDLLHCDPYFIHLKEEELKECSESLRSIFFRYPEIFIIDFEFLSFEESGKPINIDREAVSKLFETVFTTATINQLEKFFSSIVPIYLENMERARAADSEIERTYLKIEYEKYQLAKQGLNRLELSSKINFLKERPIAEHEVEKAKSQVLEEIEDALKEVISSPDIPDAEKAEFIKKTASHAVESSKARQKGVQFEEFVQQKAQALQKKGEIFSHRPKQKDAVQPPDLSEIPPYQGRRGRPRRGQPRDVTALDYLKTHYGQWLSAFGAEQDSVFQDQIRAHDPDLIKGIDNQLRTEGKGRKVRDFVKTRSDRVDRELENVSVEDLKRKPQLAGTLYTREKRAADKAKAAPSRSLTRK